MRENNGENIDIEKRNICRRSVGENVERKPAYLAGSYISWRQWQSMKAAHVKTGENGNRKKYHGESGRLVAIIEEIS
jgi:hypothetical protein